jgi:hypothetical protein
MSILKFQSLATVVKFAVKFTGSLKIKKFFFFLLLIFHVWK